MAVAGAVVAVSVVDAAGAAVAVSVDVDVDVLFSVAAAAVAAGVASVEVVVAEESFVAVSVDVVVGVVATFALVTEAVVFGFVSPDVAVVELDPDSTDPPDVVVTLSVLESLGCSTGAKGVGGGTVTVVLAEPGVDAVPEAVDVLVVDVETEVCVDAAPVVLVYPLVVEEEPVEVGAVCPGCTTSVFSVVVTVVVVVLPSAFFVVDVEDFTSFPEPSTR